MREDTDDIISSRETTHLAEPPNIRDRLIREIKFFISHLSKLPFSGSSLAEEKKGRDRAHLIEYVADKVELRVGEGGSAGGSRPRSRLSPKDGRETPLRTHSSGKIDGRYVLRR